MKLRRIVNVLAACSLLMAAKAYSQAGKLEGKSSSSAVESREVFLGRWDLTLRVPDREYPSWLEVRREGGQLKADMVGRWGNARPMPIPTAGYTCAAGTKFRWKQILPRNHRAIIRGACTDFWLLCRNFRANRESGRASISR